MPPEVSIVIPTKGRAQRLVRTLHTIRAQTTKDLEIVVSDDGSTDDTAAAVAALGDARIRLVRSTVSHGVAAARNRGIAAAKGRWVAVCDDDDLWHPDKIEQQLAALEETSARWGFCLAVHVDDDLRVLGAVTEAPAAPVAQALAWANQVPGGASSAIVQRALLDRVGGFDERLSMYADWDLWLRLVRHDEPAVWPGWGVLYLQHGDQMSRRLSQTLGELRAVKQKHASFRAAMGYPGVGGTDTYVMREMARSGERLQAVRYGLQCLRGTRSLRTAGSIGLAVAGLQRRRHPDPPPEALAAVAAVRSVLARASP